MENKWIHIAKNEMNLNCDPEDLTHIKSAEPLLSFFWGGFVLFSAVNVFAAEL